MDRLTLFNEALHDCQNLQAKYPSAETVKSVIRQIEYLIQLTNGSIQDRSRLKDIILGVQAAREIEPLDSRLADLLYKVADEALQM